MPVRRNQNWRAAQERRDSLSESVMSRVDYLDDSAQLETPLSPTVREEAPVRHIAGYFPELTYILQGGRVWSRDGDVHFVLPSQIARLYGLPPRVSNVEVYSLSAIQMPPERRVILAPQENGVYNLSSTLSVQNVAYLVREVRASDPRAPAIMELVNRVGFEGVREINQLHQRALGIAASVNLRGTTTGRVSSSDLPWPGAPRQEVTARVLPDVVPDEIEAWAKAPRIRKAPKEGSRIYLRVVSNGCVGEPDKDGEFSCHLGWTCTECPVTKEKNKLLKEVKGNRLHRFLMRKAGENNG